MTFKAESIASGTDKGLPRKNRPIQSSEPPSPHATEKGLKRKVAPRAESEDRPELRTSLTPTERDRLNVLLIKNNSDMHLTPAEHKEFWRLKAWEELERQGTAWGEDNYPTWLELKEDEEMEDMRRRSRES
ncbi:MAG: hypothetical protein WC551_00560 [Patescibacteria group bacterium]